MKRMALQEVTEANALNEFNWFVLRFNDRQGSVLQVRLRALQKMSLQCGNQAMKALYIIFSKRFPHWSFIGKYSEEKLRKLILRMSGSKITIRSEDLPIYLTERIQQNIAKRKAPEAIAREFCVIHGDKKVFHPERTEDISSHVCRECMFQLDSAFNAEELSMHVENEEMVRFLKHKIIKDQKPVFRNASISVSPEKVATHEVKKGYCEIHSERTIVASLRGLAAEHKLQICKGCAICLSRAMKKGTIGRKASSEEIRTFLKDKIGDK